MDTKKIEKIELIGYVKNVRYDLKTKERSFSLVDAKDTMYQIKCYKFAPIQDSDVVTAICLKRGAYYELTKLIDVQLSFDKGTLVKCICNALKTTYIKAIKIYNFLRSIVGSNEKIDDYLSKVSELWTSTLDSLILEDFSEVLEVGKTKRLLLWWYKNRLKRQLYLLGFNNEEIRACDMNLLDLYEQCKVDPIVILPLTLDKVSTIAERFGITYNAEELKVAEAVRDVYKNLVSRCWTSTPCKFIIEKFPQLNKKEEEQEKLLGRYKIKKDYNSFYLQKPYIVETKLTEFFAELKDRKIPRLNVDFKEVTTNGQTVELSQEQINAVEGAINNGVSVITGGAGTGKTTIIAAIVKVLEQNSIEFLLCSFTGKAVARLKEAVGKETFTMHRAKSRAQTADITKDHIKATRHIIIDEASMVTSELLYDLLKALCYDLVEGEWREIPNLTFVGDTNQLAPITWGSLLHQIIQSQTLQTFELTANYRVTQIDGEDDGIIRNAYSLVSWTQQDPAFKFTRSKNFFVYKPSQDIVVRLLERFYKEGYSSKDVTIITPYNEDTKELNRIAQNIFTFGQKEIRDPYGKLWRIGDRVICTKNDYDINVMNGTEGEVVGFKDSKGRDALMVSFVTQKGVSHDFSFENKKKAYDLLSTDEIEERNTTFLELSYALTVHKSQGSEWHYVIVYIPKTATVSFVDRSLLYTALTRAKRCVFFVGSEMLVRQSLKQKSKYKCEYFSKRLCANLKKIRRTIEDGIFETDECEGCGDIDFVDDFVYYEMDCV